MVRAASGSLGLTFTTASGLIKVLSRISPRPIPGLALGVVVVPGWGSFSTRLVPEGPSWCVPGRAEPPKISSELRDIGEGA